MKKALILAYGVMSYMAFLGVFLYLMGFVGDFYVSRTINSGTGSNPLNGILIDMGLISLFVLQHLVMARGRFKKWLTRHIPEPMERSTFVLVSSACLALLLAFWQPVPLVIWNIETEAVRWLLHATFIIGWGIVVYSSFLIDHFDLFGLRQVYLHYRGMPYSNVPFKVHSLYRYIRHPMMLGFILALWATPVMTLGHLVLAAGFTLFIFTGLWFEERDLIRNFGRQYMEYRHRTSMVIPIPKKSAVTAPKAPISGDNSGCTDGIC